MSPAADRLFLSSVFERAKELNLSPSKRLVLCALFRYLGGKDFCFPSQQNLAEDTGICLRRVKEILTELAKDGVIEITRRRKTGRKHGNNANEYRLAKSAFLNKTKSALRDSQKCSIEQPKSALSDSQKCNIEHAKTQENQASCKRAGAEYVKGIYKENMSINQSGTDGMTDEKNKKISGKKPALKKPALDEIVLEVLPRGESKSRKAGFLPWKAQINNFAPPPGAPPRLTSEQIKALFGGPVPRPVNLLGDCPEGEILASLVPPFKKGPEAFIEVIGFNPDIPQPEWFEKALKEFSELVFKIHWNWKSSPPGAPFRRLFYRAGRSGLLYDFGFRPLSPEQQEARRRELERQEEEAAEAARFREEERRRFAEKEAKLKEFIKRPVVRDYLSFLGFPPKDYAGIRDHLREIAARLNGRATLNAVEQFMREKLQNEGY